MIAPDPASEGMLLPSTHSIRLRGNSRATLNCSNDTRHPFNRPGTYAVADYCPGDVARREGPRNLPRDPFNPALPYLRSPRNTVLIAPENLLLEWKNPVQGATSYTVQIEGQGVNLALEVDEPQARFPDTDSLQPDYLYIVVITADHGLFSRNSSPVGFTVLPAAEVERVNEAVEHIKAQGLEPDIEAIALARWYLDYEHSDPERRSYALNQSALDVLAARHEAGTENPAIYLLQAEAYLASGLPLQAEAYVASELPLSAWGSYTHALALGEAAEQREIQAVSYVGLGDIAAGQTDYGEAIAHLQTAQTLYEVLGDREQVEVLQTRIEQLKEEI